MSTASSAKYKIGDGDCWIVAAARLAGHLSFVFQPREVGSLIVAITLAHAPKDNRIKEINAVIDYDGWLDKYIEALHILNPPGSPGHNGDMHVVRNFDGGNPVAALYAFYSIPITLVPYEPSKLNKMPLVAVTEKLMTKLPIMIVHEVWVHDMTFAKLNDCIEAHKMCENQRLVGGFISLNLHMIDKQLRRKTDLHVVAFFFNKTTNKFLYIDSNHNDNVLLETQFKAYKKSPFLQMPDLQELCLIYEGMVERDPATGFIDLGM